MTTSDLTPTELQRVLAFDIHADPILDRVAYEVCQVGGHLPNRDRSLPRSCDFHRKQAANYVDMVLAAQALYRDQSLTTNARNTALAEAIRIIEAEASTFPGGADDEGWPVMNLNLAADAIRALMPEGSL